MIDGSVKIKLDKVRHLRFDMNAFAEVEILTGLNSKELIEKLQKPATVHLLRECLWAALLDEDPDITVRQVGKFITADNIAELWEKLRESLTLANGSDKKPSPLPDSPGEN